MNRPLQPRPAVRIRGRHITFCSGSGMALPEWRQKLEDALKNNKEKMPFAKYYQVATIRNDLRPANRTVVHRGFYGDNAITWCTDKRRDVFRLSASDPHLGVPNMMSVICLTQQISFQTAPDVHDVVWPIRRRPLALGAHDS